MKYTLKLCLNIWLWRFKSFIHYSISWDLGSILPERENKVMFNFILYICCYFPTNSCIYSFTTKFQVLLIQFCYRSRLWSCFEACTAGFSVTLFSCVTLISTLGNYSCLFLFLLFLINLFWFYSAATHHYSFDFSKV